MGSVYHACHCLDHNDKVVKSTVSSPDDLVCFIYGRAVKNSRDLVFINEPVDCSTAMKS